VIFDKLLQVLVFGCAYRRIADGSCSATTLRDRRDEWIACGVIEMLRQIALNAYERFIGLEELADVAVHGCITKAPCGGEKAGKSPVDRGKQGTKRSTAVDGKGIPIGGISARANRNDSPLLVALPWGTYRSRWEDCRRGLASTSTAATTPISPANASKSEG
jgi:hypothetical protein